MDLTKIIETHFTNAELSWIICAFAFGLISIILFLKEKHTYSVLFLFLAGLILRAVTAGLDPFLWVWDEQYHALVAKSMVSTPFKPMLVVKPYLDYDFRNWQANHIWLHKQPFFLWQIALFFKIFGVGHYVLRLPTVIMMSLMTLFIYRIGLRVSTPAIAWYGAFLYGFSFFFVEMVSGCIATDHNDAAFIFYVTLSIWAWVEYNHSHNRYWLFLIGAFAGIAVLTKWVVGLLVYSGWWLSILVCHKKSEWFREYKNMGISLLVSILVALPWQIFILIAYPRESRFEFAFNSEHFFKAVEGHGGIPYHHFHLLAEQYGGILVTFLIVPGLYLLFTSMKNKVLKVGMFTFLAATYLFFSLAATKMDMFCLIVSPIVFLGLGAVLDFVVTKFRGLMPATVSTWLLVLLLGYMAYDNLMINKIDTRHSNNNPYWKGHYLDGVINRYIARELPSEEWLVFNTGGNNAIMFMFYNNAGAYGIYPSYNEYYVLKSQGVKIATLADENLPLYLKQDPQVRKFYIKPYVY
jgi:4-amino-4-deoxy-L-arabinose transferase-like glycosyltransferase